ncbi:MAG: hypothetical protein IJI67_06260 [Clostridia bacterium]|nr:hypothetical protein [Clostridia bacterium]
MNQIELNNELLRVFSTFTINFSRVENLLQQGAEPLGKVQYHRVVNNLYDSVLDVMLCEDVCPEDFVKLTALFLRYGMDIAKPSIPYDGDNIINPLWSLAFVKGEAFLKVLKLLLDNGLSAEDASCCWNHAVCDLVQFGFVLDNEYAYECLYDCIKKLMLIASYEHILIENKDLQEEIWYNYAQNQYDLKKFRNWNDFLFEVDTSRCERKPEPYKSVVTIIEKSNGLPVWKFGLCLTPEEIE